MNALYYLAKYVEQLPVGKFTELGMLRATTANRHVAGRFHRAWHAEAAAATLLHVRGDRPRRETPPGKG